MSDQYCQAEFRGHRVELNTRTLRWRSSESPMIAIVLDALTVRRFDDVSDSLLEGGLAGIVCRRLRDAVNLKILKIPEVPVPNVVI